MSVIYIFLWLLTTPHFISTSDNHPHIIFLLADDLGWNDVGFHGNNDIPTPNIDALAYSGLILNNYYVNPICTPSRSALMTGKYPIHTGMQHTVLYGAEPRGLPLSEKLLPEYLRELGYVNRIVGKWHLGSYRKEYTPTFRGFDSHLGFWTGHQDYYNYTAVETPGWGLDVRRDLNTAPELVGTYSTRAFTQEAVQIIGAHNVTKPLFLYLAYGAVHSANADDPLQAPAEQIRKFAYLRGDNEQKFAGMLAELDDSVGEVVQALSNANMLENSIVVFSSDNGGPAAGFNLNAASNYPLRGVKNTLWEGGVRGVGLIWSLRLQTQQTVAHQLMDVSDWLPTLLNCSVNNLDGVNQWEALALGKNSNRTEILHNIDDIYGNAALTVDGWKLLKGSTYNGSWDSWYGPNRRDFSYNISKVLTSAVGGIVSKFRPLSVDTVESLRAEATVTCTGEITTTCDPFKGSCLYYTRDDPCELKNLAGQYPEILSRLETRLREYNRTAVLPGNLPLDPRGNPQLWNNTWTNFGDLGVNAQNDTLGANSEGDHLGVNSQLFYIFLLITVKDYLHLYVRV